MSRDICNRFLSALELWRDTQRTGVSAFNVLASALEEFAAAKNWQRREKALSDYGVDTSFMDVRQWEAEEQAGALLRAETALCNLHEALQGLQTCYHSMEQMHLNFTRVSEADCDICLSEAELIKERLSVCLGMYRTELEVVLDVRCCNLSICAWTDSLHCTS
jgi:hypothetical protein